MASNYNSEIKKYSITQLRALHAAITKNDLSTISQKKILWLILCNIRLSGKFTASMRHIADSVGIPMPIATREINLMREGDFIDSRAVEEDLDDGEFGRTYFIKEMP